MTDKDWIRRVFKERYPEAAEQWIEKAIEEELKFQNAGDFVDERAALKKHSQRIRNMLTLGEWD